MFVVDDGTISHMCLRDVLFSTVVALITARCQVLVPGTSPRTSVRRVAVHTVLPYLYAYLARVRRNTKTDSSTNTTYKYQFRIRCILGTVGIKQ